MLNVSGTTTKPGPEADLVNNFVNSISTIDDNDTLIFIEPNIGVLQPDIVLVSWNSSAITDWKRDIGPLSTSELRLIHLLYLEGPCSQEKIERIFTDDVNKLLRKLFNYNICSHKDELWKINNLNKIFAIRKIVAFEAKISYMSKAINQAYLNSWFSSESYMLIPDITPTRKTIDLAEKRGIGIWKRNDDEKFTRILVSENHKVPNSYASWIFNELCWVVTNGYS